MMPVNKNIVMVGTAITVSTDDGDNFPIHVATYSAKPGYVMVIDGKGYDKRAYFGDLIMGAAKAVGLEGMVMDGYTRDTIGCLELEFPVYSKGILQAGPIKKNPGELNVTIMCGGISVEPGDLVVGGADGVTVVPREHVYEVLDKAEDKLRYEEKREETIAEYNKSVAEGKEPPQLAPQWVLDMMENV